MTTYEMQESLKAKYGKDVEGCTIDIHIEDGFEPLAVVWTKKCKVFFRLEDTGWEFGGTKDY